MGERGRVSVDGDVSDDVKAAGTIHAALKEQLNMSNTPAVYVTAVTLH